MKILSIFPRLIFYFLFMASYQTSMTSQIVFILVIVVVILQLWNFIYTKEIMEIFNSLVSAFIGAYLQRQISPKTTTPPQPATPEL